MRKIPDISQKVLKIEIFARKARKIIRKVMESDVLVFIIDSTVNRAGILVFSTFLVMF